MKLPAKRVERLFKFGFIDAQLPGQTEELEMFRTRRDGLDLSAFRAKVRVDGRRPAIRASRLLSVDSGSRHTIHRCLRVDNADFKKKMVESRMHPTINLFQNWSPSGG
jgi:hypothetical protein